MRSKTVYYALHKTVVKLVQVFNHTEIRDTKYIMIIEKSLSKKKDHCTLRPKYWY